MPTSEQAATLPAAFFLPIGADSFQADPRHPGTVGSRTRCTAGHRQRSWRPCSRAGQPSCHRPCGSPASASTSSAAFRSAELVAAVTIVSTRKAGRAARSDARGRRPHRPRRPRLVHQRRRGRRRLPRAARGRSRAARSRPWLLRRRFRRPSRRSASSAPSTPSATGDANEWRFTSGGFDQLGPGGVWSRPRVPLIAGEPLTGLARLLILADAANGISGTLDWNDWVFIPPGTHRNDVTRAGRRVDAPRRPHHARATTASALCHGHLERRARTRGARLPAACWSAAARHPRPTTGANDVARRASTGERSAGGRKHVVRGDSRKAGLGPLTVGGVAEGRPHAAVDSRPARAVRRGCRLRPRGPDPSRARGPPRRPWSGGARRPAWCAGALSSSVARGHLGFGVRGPARPSPRRAAGSRVRRAARGRAR